MPWMKNSTALRRVAGFVTLAVMGLIAVLSLLPPSDLPPVEGSDKLKHFIAYTALAMPMAVWTGRGRALLALLLAAGFGLAVEVAQLLVPTGREFSLLDEGANILGAGLGTLAVLILRHRGLFGRD
ncbi:MAG TPA: VanZ family protein [Hyphomonas sp.]|nr:VanZ family protein [Hyphomonas sp.]HRX72756.1 VanZ family protein [Hyphomonas sp.]